jgi:hypothetical protein
MGDVAIDDFLAGLGLTGAGAARGRAALEAAGLTNPRKQRISDAKLEPARRAIDAVLARLCDGCAGGADLDGRELVPVDREHCVRCGGSSNTRALEEVVQRCRAHGVRHLVVVGGSPSVRKELATIGDRLDLRLIDGTARRTQAQADNDLDWADLVVVCGGSELAHKVSKLYTGAGGPTPVVTASRRGVEAIAGEVVTHLDRRR